MYYIKEYLKRAHREIDTIFRVLFPEHGMAVREEQIMLCHEMLDNLLGRNIALCDAGVGIGKTYAYLVACVLMRKYSLLAEGCSPYEQRPVVISTSSITLQKAKVRVSSSLWLIRCNKSGERKSTIQTETTVWSRNIVETQDFCYNGCRTLDDGKRDGKPMNISYQPLWNTLKERGMRKEDLRLAAGLTTNMIANMGKGEHISMKTLLRICEALNCGILDVIELTQDEEN